MAPGSQYFQIQYDNKNLRVDVRGYAEIEDWPEINAAIEDKPEGDITTVIVEVDQVESLRAAYPNYFLDMSLFESNLEKIIIGQKLDLVQKTEQQVLSDAEVKILDRINMHGCEIGTECANAHEVSVQSIARWRNLHSCITQD